MNLQALQPLAVVVAVADENSFARALVGVNRRRRNVSRARSLNDFSGESLDHILNPLMQLFVEHTNRKPHVRSFATLKPAYKRSRSGGSREPASPSPKK